MGSWTGSGGFRGLRRMPGLLRFSGMLPMNMGPNVADNIRQVFDRARKSAPCILVMEDEAEVPSEQSLLGMPGFMMGRRFIPR